jgi:hypothetical protein
MQYPDFPELTTLGDDDILLVHNASTLALMKVKLSTLKQYMGVTATPVAVGIKTEMLADDPIGYWQLDETTGIVATNLGSGMSNGTYASVLLGQPKLATGSAYSASFNGSNSKIAFTNTLQSNSIDLTLECVIKLSDTRAKGSFIKLGDGGSGIGLGVGSNTFDSFGNTLIGLAESLLWKPTPISIGTGTHHIVLVYRGASSKEWLFYLDGTLGSTLGGTNIISPTSVSYIGSSGTDRFFNGGLDEVAIYNKELTPARIVAHANAVIY